MSIRYKIFIEMFKAKLEHDWGQDKLSWNEYSAIKDWLEGFEE